MSEELKWWMYFAGLNSEPSQTMEPATAGARVSGIVAMEELLRRLSREDFALRLDVDIMQRA